MGIQFREKKLFQSTPNKTTCSTEEIRSLRKTERNHPTLKRTLPRVSTPSNFKIKEANNTLASFSSTASTMLITNKLTVMPLNTSSLESHIDPLSLQESWKPCSRAFGSTI